MKIIAIVQARLGSVRLPNKVIKYVYNNISLIQVLLTRLSKSKLINEIVVATTVDKKNIELIKLVRNLGHKCEKGSENNVLERFVNVGKKYNADVIVRITGDCPLVDPELVDNCIELFKEKDVDYCSNVLPATFPDGLDIEVINFNSLSTALRKTTNKDDLEHVTPFIRNSQEFTKYTLLNDTDLSDLRWTVDDHDDLEVIRSIFEHFRPNVTFNWKSVLKLQIDKPSIFAKNKNTKRNNGALLNSGQKLWSRAKKVIPGGNLLLSKRPEMFLPEQWPSYYSEAKGCIIKDLDKNEYIDMSIMGIGTNVLGYGHKEVDKAVLKTLAAGNMSTLNCPEEVYLAERLLEIHPWADKVRYARTGGEANSIAVRIARAASGKDKIAFCGYHGWHDWYLAANLGQDSNLDGHLLPGLAPKGVPRNLKDTIFPFVYNDYDELEKLVEQHDIGVIKMEVMRNYPPKNNFLTKVRRLATEKNIVLIFDECTSGFRETFGGLHKKYEVEPDIAIFGKALGNGYAITAIIGKSAIMEECQSSFISSTFWTERIGPSAALKTLEVMEREKTWETITEKGIKIRKGWEKLSATHGIEINHFGIPAICGFSFKGPNALKYKTLITQEMLKKGFLAANLIFVSIAHEDAIIDQYLEKLDQTFRLVNECEQGRDVDSLLTGPVCHSSFSRIN
jgi:glutamate-1-semialdehyde 2,1-aminomutase